MNPQTALYHDEWCYWHTTGEHVLFMPAGGWLQPGMGIGHPESPESKRRIKALLDVSGLTAKLDQKSASPATMEDLWRVHGADYLRRLKQMSDAGGGNGGLDAPFGKGSYEIACLSAGLAKRAVHHGNGTQAIFYDRADQRQIIDEMALLLQQ